MEAVNSPRNRAPARCDRRPRGAAAAALQSPPLRCPQPARPRCRRPGPGDSALATAPAAPARQRHRNRAPTPTAGGMVHPARLGAPSAAAHPRWAEPSLLKRRGGRGRPAGPGAHAPSSPPRSQPPSRRPTAAPTAAGLHGSGRLTELLPARAGHRPAGLRSPFRRCGAGRRGACARRGRTRRAAGGRALRGLEEALPAPGARLTASSPPCHGSTCPKNRGASQLGRDRQGSSTPWSM